MICFDINLKKNKKHDFVTACQLFQFKGLLLQVLNLSLLCFLFCIRNRPVTPRSLDNRYGKTVSKSPTSTQTMPWDSPSTESKPMQNGTHSSGDETKQNKPAMVPMSVTRNMHNKQHERSAGGAPGPSKDSMPSKGRGQVLQSMLSGNPPEPAGMVGNVSNNSHPSREHGKMQQDKELDRNYLGDAGDKLQHGMDQSCMQQSRDNVQQGRENEQRGLGRNQGGMQQSD